MAQKKLSGVHTRADVLQTVSQGVGQLDVGGGACLLHVVAGDGDRVELRHLLRGELKDVGDDLHRELGRIDVRVTYHELLEDIVLNSTGHFLELRTLLQTCVDIERQDRQHGAVHGHGHGHLVQWNTVEQHFHILYRADTYTGLTHITHYALVVSVVATVRRQVESYGQTLLTRCQVTAVEGVGLGSGREACVLTNGPGTQRIHGAVRATKERRNTRGIAQMLHALQVVCGIYVLNRNTLRRQPISIVRSFERRSGNGFDIYFLKIWFHNASYLRSLFEYLVSSSSTLTRTWM